MILDSRSAAYAKLGKFNMAITDAKRCIEIAPESSKVSGYQ